MATEQGMRGGSHEQHVKAGQQSHKTAGVSPDQDMRDQDQKSGGTSQGGTHEQHVKAGEQSHKNTTGGASGSQGGTHEQHVKAGQQSHKNA